MKKRRFIISCFLFVYLIWGCLDLSRTSASDLNAFVFPEVAGWKQSAEIQTFVPKTLFEYINGGADLYLTYDFQELKVAEYSNEKKASVTVEVYRHRTPTYAFGIYSEERLPDANFVAMGTQGYIEENVLNFLAGSYYVKISGIHTGSDDQEILLSFAKKVSGQLGEKGTLPQILSSFPEEGKVKNSERFIPIKFLGYAFLHSAFTAAYQSSGTKFEIFVIEGGDGDDCKDMIQKYLQQTGNPEKKVLEERYKIRDPYHGEIELQWQGKYIWGILNSTNSDLRSKYLKLFEESLKKKTSSG
ncbi:MAG TPA: DUF6599 family protein [Thermodesulfobacteriota bacterium]|nr:DUF6599 family protein [Thermodesulfobacteriota bacterium]